MLSAAPLFETQCSYVEATLEQFLSWTRPQTGSRLGPFCEYPSSEYWAYADYKYIALLLQDRPAMFQVLGLQIRSPLGTAPVAVETRDIAHSGEPTSWFIWVTRCI